MPMITSTQIIYDGERNAIVLMSGRGDGSAFPGNESLVRKIRASDFNPRPAAFKVKHVWYDVSSTGLVRLYWDDPGAPVEFLVLNSPGEPIDFSKMGGLVNRNRAGTSGDILLSTQGFDATSSYSIKVEMVKKFKF